MDPQKGFYSVAQTTGRPEWVEKNSSNKRWAQEWIFVYGPELQDLPFFNYLDVKKFKEPGFTIEEKRAYDDFIIIRDGDTKWSITDFESSDWIARNTGSSHFELYPLCF